MFIVNVKTKKKYKIEIELVDEGDFRRLTKKKYFFNWKLEKDYEVYKLTILDKSDILGLISVERIPEEYRIHVRLLSVSTENKGKNKVHKRIVGNLLTYISKIAIKEFAELACVSLKTKGAIADHYIKKYGMNVTGSTLSLEIIEIIHLIKKYDYEKK